MTYIPEFLPKMTNNDPLARCALFVAFEGMGLLDLTGPLTVVCTENLNTGVVVMKSAQDGA
jgi:hypothetical protein